MRGFGASISTALSTVKAALACGLTSGDARSSVIPDECTLSHVWLEIASIAGGATAITWYLAADAAGDVAIAPSVTSAIVIGKTTPTDGSVCEAVDLEWCRPSSGAVGVLYLICNTNVGTANAIGRVHWSRP